MKRKKGFFITIEGPEGSGKTTLAEALFEFLQSKNVPVFLTYEPGGSALGQVLRQELLHQSYLTNAWAELFLFEADRAQHVEEVIGPALDKNRVVICCRFYDSTTAYQGYGRGLDLDLIARLNEKATGGLIPDLTLLLDIAPEKGLPRAFKSRGKKDRLEAEELSFHRKLRKGFLTLAKKEPKRIRVIRADQAFEDVKKEAIQLIEKLESNF